MKARIVIFIFLSAVCLLNAQDSGRETILLDDGWQFIKTDLGKGGFGENSGWQDVTIPHTWNNKDAQSGEAFYAGTCWYRRAIAPGNFRKEGRAYIRFQGVGQVADVYFNGRHVGQHKGAYSAFCFDVTPWVKFDETNWLYVRANNEARPDIIPINHFLFMVFGGIYRPVELITADQIHIATTDYASPGIYITQKEVDRQQATIEVKSKLENFSGKSELIELVTTIIDREKQMVAEAKETILLGPAAMQTRSQQLTVEKPTLWHGRQNPYLYQVKVELRREGKVLDVVVQPLGIRTFAFDSEKGFILNGKPYRLYGVCRHQEWKDYGSALSNVQHEEDFRMIREIGATSVRLAHYQQADYVYSICDREGLLVWAEIPFVNKWSGQEAENARQQLKELIRQNYNHPSIFTWGLHNEVYADSITDYPVLVNRELHNLAKTEDPKRPTVSVNGHGVLNRPMNYHADLQGINRYYGWYSGPVKNLESWIINLKKERPGVFFSIAEYGGGGNVFHQREEVGQQPDPTKGQFFPEIYQTMLHEKQWGIIKKHPEIWASYVWNMFDFAVPLWDRGGIKGRNHKGLVTYDRKTKKDSFYWYKANWSKEPLLHISGKRIKERSSRTNIVVYSNQGTPSLYINGKLQPNPQTGETDVHYIWVDVVLSKGSNRVVCKVEGKGSLVDEAIFIVK